MTYSNKIQNITNFTRMVSKVTLLAVLGGVLFVSCQKQNLPDGGEDSEQDGRVVTLFMTTTSADELTRSNSIGPATEDNDPLAFDISSVMVFPLDADGNPIKESDGVTNKSFKVSMIPASPDEVLLDENGEIVSSDGHEYKNYYVATIKLDYAIEKVAVYLNYNATSTPMTVNDRQGDYLAEIVPAVGHADVVQGASSSSYYASVVVDPLMARIQIVNDLLDGEMGYYNEVLSRAQSPIASREELYANKYYQFLRGELGIEFWTASNDGDYALKPLYDLLRIEGFYLNRTYMDINEEAYIAENPSPAVAPVIDVTSSSSWHTAFAADGAKKGLFATYDSPNAASKTAIDGDYAWRITPFIHNFHYMIQRGPSRSLNPNSTEFNALNNYYFCNILGAATYLGELGSDPFVTKEFYAFGFNYSIWTDPDTGETVYDDEKDLRVHENWDWHVNENLKSSFFQNSTEGSSRDAALGFNLYAQGKETLTNEEARNEQPHLVVQFSYFGKYHENIIYGVGQQNSISRATWYDPSGAYKYNPESVATLSSAIEFMGESINQYYTITKKNLNLVAFKDPLTGTYPAFEGGYVYTIKLSDIIRMILDPTTEVTPEGNEDPQEIFSEIEISVGHWTDQPLTPEPGDKPVIGGV